jgi:ABC-type amino acid transport substrate-binding protein
MMVWQQHDRNEWATSIERALAPDEATIASSPAARQPFSLGDPDVVRRILDSAGFAAPTFDEVRASVYYGSDVDAALELVSRFAVVQEMVARLDVGQREAAPDRLRQLLAAHGRTDGISFDSRSWIVATRRS